MPASNSGFVKEVPTEHVLVRVERARYVYFICPAQPQLELVSFDVPKQCPICRMWKPVTMGLQEGRSEASTYSDMLGAVIEPLAEGN